MVPIKFNLFFKKLFDSFRLHLQFGSSYKSNHTTVNVIILWPSEKRRLQNKSPGQ
jgi:hypothetical protein